MRIISLHISKLLLTNDKVIVNGLGYFVATEQKAYHHPVSHDFTPKNKKLSFYLDKNAKSPLLEKSLGLTNGDIKIHAFVVKVVTALKNNQDVVLDNLGTLKRHEKGHVVFVQSDEIVFDKNFFGMEAFTHNVAVKGKTIEKPVSAPVKEKKSRKIIYLFAALGLVASLILAYIFTDLDKIFKESVSVEQLIAEKVVEPVLDVDTLENTLIEDSNSTENQIAEQNIDSIESPEALVEDAIIVNTIEQVSAEENTEENNAPVKALVQKNTGNYYIMAGCFKSSFKANRLLKELKDGDYPNASINGKTESGLIRVCYNNFTTKSEAEKQMLKISEKVGKELWMQKINN